MTTPSRRAVRPFHVALLGALVLLVLAGGYSIGGDMARRDAARAEASR